METILDGRVKIKKELKRDNDKDLCTAHGKMGWIQFHLVQGERTGQGVVEDQCRPTFHEEKAQDDD